VGGVISWSGRGDGVSGGLAAARGARTGAETTARATIERARTQERAQHDHWLRDERKRAAVLMLEAYDRFTIAASNVTRMFDLESRHQSTSGALIRRA
jgi:hypothetical protein